MKIAELHEFSVNAKRVADHARATGPRSPEGKARSAINAVKHGLAARGLLLPGEAPDDYTARMDGVFAALAPVDECQAQLAALIGDDLWKLDRLARIEHGVTLGRVEELLGVTQTAAEGDRTLTALVALGNALRGWEAQPAPAERSPEFKRRVRAMGSAIDCVADLVAEIPADAIGRCNELVVALADERRGATVPMDLCAAMFEAGAKLMSVLMGRGDRCDAEQQELRKAISAIALPDEAELKKLARYRKMLEEGLQRRLLALEQLRKLAAASPGTSETIRKAHEYRLKLRVVA